MFLRIQVITTRTMRRIISGRHRSRCVPRSAPWLRRNWAGQTFHRMILQIRQPWAPGTRRRTPFSMLYMKISMKDTSGWTILVLSPGTLWRSRMRRTAGVYTVKFARSTRIIKNNITWKNAPDSSTQMIRPLFCQHGTRIFCRCPLVRRWGLRLRKHGPSGGTLSLRDVIILSWSPESQQDWGCWVCFWRLFSSVISVGSVCGVHRVYGVYCVTSSWVWWNGACLTVFTSFTTLTFFTEFLSQSLNHLIT